MVRANQEAIMWASLLVLSVLSPAAGDEDLAEKGQTVYSAELNAEAAKALTRAASYRNLAKGGKARVWLDAKGRVTKYEVNVKVKGSLGDAEVDGERTTAVTLGGLNSTKVEV